MSKPDHYEFGPFRLDARERLLLRDGESVALTPKAFDLLLACWWKTSADESFGLMARA